VGTERMDLGDYGDVAAGVMPGNRRAQAGEPATDDDDLVRSG